MFLCQAIKILDIYQIKIVEKNYVVWLDKYIVLKKSWKGVVNVNNKVIYSYIFYSTSVTCTHFGIHKNVNRD